MKPTRRARTDQPLLTVWLTRDSDVDGNVLNEVRVWTECPRRFRDSLGTYWTVANPEALHGTYRLDWALHYYRTIPDDDRMLVRNGVV